MPPIAVSPPPSAVRKARLAIALFIAGLVLSGLTAFPLLAELNLLARGVSAFCPPSSALRFWILHVRDGLADTYAKYPWVAYGTDWLAFGHLIIALFFIPAWRDPVRHTGTLRLGVFACILVLPLALIAGPVRGIPFCWRLIDCSFGVFGVVPLLYALRQIKTTASLAEG